MKDVEIERLAAEGMKLVQLDVDQLYATLGGQLLSRNLPTRVAGFIRYLSAVLSASEAKALYHRLPAEPSLTEWGRGLGIIYDELRQDGIDFIDEMRTDLRKSICNEDILRLSSQLNVSTLQIVILVVSATLRMPREFDPIAVTVAVILVKIGLQKFCSET